MRKNSASKHKLVVDAAMLPIAHLYSRLLLLKLDELIPPLAPVQMDDQVLGPIGTEREDFFIRTIFHELSACKTQLHLVEAQEVAARTKEGREYFAARRRQLRFKVFIRECLLTEALDDRFGRYGEPGDIELRFGWIAVLPNLEPQESEVDRTDDHAS